VKRGMAMLVLLASAAGAQKIYDILLKNGQVIDPANRRAGRYDLAVIGNKFARVARSSGRACAHRG
jgi:hypothetical protein